MLFGAGIRCAGEYPGFEDEQIINSPTPEFVDSFIGGAIKLLEPNRVLLPTGRSYRFIFLTRSRRQQSASTMKLVYAANPNLPRLSEGKAKEVEDSLRADEALGMQNIEAHNCPILKVRFEDLIDWPNVEVARIAAFLEIDDREAMRKCIRHRSSACYPGLLELELLKEVKAEESTADATA
jgi:hypothetical protein